MSASESAFGGGWKLAVLRATLFPSENFDPATVDRWRLLTGGVQLDTDQVKQVPPPTQRFQAGPHLGGRLSILQAPGRIDVMLSGNAPSAPGELPFISGDATPAERFGDLALHAVDAFRLRLTRIAFMAQLLMPTSSLTEVMVATKAAIPGLPIDDTDSEVVFRRVSPVPGPGDNQYVNYIDAWTSVRVQMVPVPVIGSVTMQVPMGQASFALQREIEANTDPTNAATLTNAAATMRRLVEIVIEKLKEI